MNKIKFWHRIQLPDGSYTPGLVNHGPDGGDWPTTRFGLPENLIGKTVLDIGAWDGFFSFEAEKRGAAHVTALNVPGGPPFGNDGWKYAKEQLKSNVIFAEGDIETMPTRAQFDVVLFYGVLYHLKSPLIALDNVCKLTANGGVALVETAIATGLTAQLNDPILVYQPGYDNDPTNYFYPNTPWLIKAAEQVGFKKCELVHHMGSRATYRLIK